MLLTDARSRQMIFFVSFRLTWGCFAFVFVVVRTSDQAKMRRFCFVSFGLSIFLLIRCWERVFEYRVRGCLGFVVRC